MWPLRIEGNCFHSDLCINSMPASCMNLLPAGKIYNAPNKPETGDSFKFIQLHNLYKHQLNKILQKSVVQFCYSFVTQVRRIMPRVLLLFFHLISLTVSQGMS